MNSGFRPNFRCHRDELVDIEKRWGLVVEREQYLNKREADLRAREEQFRRLLQNNSTATPVFHEKKFGRDRHSVYAGANKNYSKYAAKRDEKSVVPKQPVTSISS